jgi:spore coat polysaccharide biosynthesis protein SpsF
VIAVIAQARMSSTRLPGKSLRALHGERTTLELHLERVRRAAHPDLVLVATSTDPSDDPLAELAANLGVEVVRGPLDDVAARYVRAIEQHALTAFVRTSADSPLLDQALIDRGVELFREGGHEVVSNVRPKTYASGHSVEVVDAPAFLGAYAEMSEPADREHVTSFLYGHPERFRHRHFRQARNDGGLQLAVDTEADAQLVEAIIARMERPHWDYRYDEVMELYREVAA